MADAAASAAEIFPPDHYDTAKHIGLSRFSDAWGKTTAELGLTIQALEARLGRSPVFRRQDLIGYHFLHYGEDNEVTDQVLDSPLYETEWARPLNEALPKIIGPRTVQPIDMGRIALGLDTEVDHTLEHLWTERVDIQPDDTPGGARGTRRIGEFLYPREDIAIRYLGRSSIDLLEEHPDGYVRSDRTGHGGIILNSLAFHVDAFSINNPDGHQTEVYNAISYDENSHSRLKKIVQVDSFITTS